MIDYLETQTQTILEHLQAGRRISTWDAYSLYNITSLAQRVHELRKKGYVIDGRMVTHDGRRFKIYWLCEQLTQIATATSPVTSEGISYDDF